MWLDPPKLSCLWIYDGNFDLKSITIFLYWMLSENFNWGTEITKNFLSFLIMLLKGVLCCLNRLVLRLWCHLVSPTTLHLLLSISSISFFKPGLFFLGIPHIVLIGIGNNPWHIYLYQVSGHATMYWYLNTESCSNMKHLSSFVRVCVSILHQKFERFHDTLLKEKASTFWGKATRS